MKELALEGMVELGRARRAQRDITALGSPEPGPSLTRALDEMRADERY